MQPRQKLDTLLIANRGEIALRIMRTARRLGIRSVAVYSEADASAPFVRAADEAVCIGPAAATESYLRIDRILDAARQTGADAVHPGYGFLSENTELARQCEAAGLLFVGPPASAISAMGSKSAAKALIEKAGVPLVPGYHGDDQSLPRFEAAAQEMGFPILIKASAGGGGKGMRVVRNNGELADAIGAAQREASAAFGDVHLLLERYLETPRHVEVQVLFDRHGQGRYLFDRDCSVQRRHQKIIEEAPAPGIPEDIRRAMGEAAVRCGEAIGYVGAGTVEFLYEPDGRFYFMEMNTRLQVEHPVTEMITGLDLVAWQLRVAQGDPLPWRQDQLQCQGHAMEVRVYAEDPDNDFLPVTGTLTYLREPLDQPRVRVDSGVEEGQEIGPWYDPMLAKVIAWGEDRDSARRRLRDALCRYRADGLTLNTDYVWRILGHPAFADADLSTHFIERWRDDLAAAVFSPAEQAGLTWLAWFLASAATPGDDPWSFTDSWRIGPPDTQRCEIRLESAQSGDGDQALTYRVDGPDCAQVTYGDLSFPLRWERDGNQFSVLLPQRRVLLDWHTQGERLTVFADAYRWQALVNHPEERQGSVAADGALTAPMHGRVTQVLCRAGENVKAGAALVVLEAMKMEHTLKAPADGRVVAVLCEENAGVEAAQALVEFEREAGNDGE